MITLELTFYIKNDYMDERKRVGIPTELCRDTLDEALTRYLLFARRGPALLGAVLDGQRMPLALHRTVLWGDHHREHMLTADIWSDPKWWESPVIQAAVERLRTELDIKRMVCDGRILDMTCGEEPPGFWTGKSLDPAGGFPFFERVYVVGYGWLTPEGYDLDFPWDQGHPPYVDRYHIRYVGTDGQRGEADISPLDYDLLLNCLDLEDGGMEAEDEDTSD